MNKPHLTKWVLSLWPPFLGAGIFVKHIGKDFREVNVVLRDIIVNRNYYGVHFGGSLYAMIDPFFMLMIIKNLDKKYYVWDIHAAIDFLKPAKGTIEAKMALTDDDIENIKQGAARGEKFEKQFTVELRDQKEQVVARISKTVYIRLKPEYRIGI